MENQEVHSFVILHDLTEDAICMYATDSVTDLLGWEPQDIIGRSFYDLVHPEEIEAARRLHYEHVRHDYAASLTYLRLNHKEEDDKEEWALCAFSRSVAYNMVVGTVSLATPDPGNARAATATGGVFVLTPTAHHLAFRRWNTRLNLTDKPVFTGSPNDYSIPIEKLPTPSKRVAIILDRFKQKQVFVLHCSNDCIVPSELIFNQDLLRFIPADVDKEGLNEAITLVKTWGSRFESATDGIFAFCQFTIEIPTFPQQKVHGIVSAALDAVVLTLVLVD